MAELVECARLEIAYTGNCIEGSNPPISARYLLATTAIFYYTKTLTKPYFVLYNTSTTKVQTWENMKQQTKKKLN